MTLQRSRNALLAALACALTLCASGAFAESINPPTKPQLSPAMTPAERANLDMVLEWWRVVLEGGYLGETGKYQATDYIQHNPNLPTGQAAFVNFFKNVIKMPQAPVVPAWLNDPPVVAGAKGDFVFLIFEHEAPHPTQAGDTYHWNSFEVLRIQNGKVQEHWDSFQRQPLPAGAPPRDWAQPAWQHARGSLGTLSALERQNLAVATRELKDLLQYGHLEMADQVLAEGYIQHNPRVPQGRAGFVEFMSANPNRKPLPIKDEWINPPGLTITSGPYVVMMWERKSPDPETGKDYSWTHFDVMRVEDGVVQEHWDEAVLAAQ